MLRKLAIIGVVAVLFGINGAVAQNAPLTDCDTLASNPNDPQRKAPGVLPDKINPTLAVPACEKAVAQYPDDMRLNFQLGRAYEIAKKIPLALRQYQKTADQGYAPGQSNLGFFYVVGIGVGRDANQAMAWFRKAAAQGYAPAQANIGILYRDGIGVAKDPQEALKWLRLSAEQKYGRAQVNIGSMYYGGEGVAKDLTQAIIWFRLAGEQDDSQAQTNLGLMYMRGEGAKTDDREAVTWFRRAAAQGEATAQLNLGTLYAMGRGVGRDFLRSYMWLSLAAPKLKGSEANEVSGNIGIVEKKLTAAQLAQAKDMARSCEARHFQNCD